MYVCPRYLKIGTERVNNLVCYSKILEENAFRRSMVSSLMICYCTMTAKWTIWLKTAVPCYAISIDILGNNTIVLCLHNGAALQEEKVALCTLCLPVILTYSAPIENDTKTSVHLSACASAPGNHGMSLGLVFLWFVSNIRMHANTHTGVHEGVRSNTPL